MVPERRQDRNLMKDGRSMARAMYGVQLKDRKRAKGLMVMVGLNEAIDLLDMSNSVH